MNHLTITQDNNDIITNNQEFTINELSNDIPFSLTKSILLNTYLKDNNTIISNKTKYKPILVDIFRYILLEKEVSFNTLASETSFNFKVPKQIKDNNKRGYKLDKELNIYIQNKDSDNTFKEIIKLTKKYEYQIDLKIKLSNENIIHITNFII